MRLEDLDLSALMQDVAALRREDDSRPRIHVQDGMQVHGDASMLRQLADNLLGNAIKYVAPGVRPNIIVNGETEGDLLRISVDDNGIGVPPELRRSIFENFRRGATDYTGTGHRSGHLPAHRRAPRRHHHRGGQPARRRQPVRLHAAAGGRGARCRPGRHRPGGCPDERDGLRPSGPSMMEPWRG